MNASLTVDSFAVLNQFEKKKTIEKKLLRDHRVQSLE